MPAVPPVNTVAPVLTGAVTIGGTQTIAAGTWTGTPAPTFTYTLYRDGVPDGTETSRTEAQMEAYVMVASDVASQSTRVWQETATNAAGSASVDSNSIIFAPAVDLTAKLKLWFSGSAGITLNTGKVETWTDSVQSYAVTQATADARPVITEVGGVDCVDFDGVDDFLAAAVNLTTPLGATPGALEIYAAVYIDALAAGANFGTQAIAARTGSNRVQLGVSASTGFFYTDAGAAFCNTSVAPEVEVMLRIRASDDSTDFLIKVGNDTGATATSGVQTSTNYDGTLRVGASAGANLLDGKIRHLMFFVDELTAGERADLDAWLVGECGAQI